MLVRLRGVTPIPPRNCRPRLHMLPTVLILRKRTHAYGETRGRVLSGTSKWTELWVIGGPGPSWLPVVLVASLFPKNGRRLLSGQYQAFPRPDQTRSICQVHPGLGQQRRDLISQVGFYPGQ